MSSDETNAYASTRVPEKNEKQPLRKIEKREEKNSKESISEEINVDIKVGVKKNFSIA